MTKRIDIEVPSLKDIPLSNLLKYIEVFEKGDNTASQYAAFKYLCGMEKELVDAISFKELNEVYEAIQVQLSKTDKLRRGFTLNGVNYGMIPNLENSSFGEFIELDQYTTNTLNGIIDHKQAIGFMSVMFRPITYGDVSMVYKIEPFTGDEPKSIMANAPSDVYLGALSFFLSLKEMLLSGFLLYFKGLSEKEKKRAIKRKNIKIDSDGLEQLIISQVAMLQSGRQSLKYRLPTLSLNSQWSKVK